MTNPPSERPVAVVGLGRIAEAHLEALGRLGVPVVGVDHDPVRAEHWRSLGMIVAGSASEALASGELRAAAICTPPDVRAEVATPFVDRGVSVLVEKPLGLSPAASRALLERARSARAGLDTASKFGVMPALARARQWIAEGAIGGLQEIHIVFSGRLDVRSDWRAARDHSGGGVWMDNGPHALDIAMALAGPVDCVRWVEAGHEQGTAVEDAVRIEMRHADGVSTRVDLTWNENRPAPIARICGDQGSIVVGWRELVLQPVDGAPLSLPLGYDKAACFRAIWEHFFAAQGGGAPSWSGGERGVAAVEVVEAGYSSALRGGSWVPTGMGRSVGASLGVGARPRG